MLPAESAPLFLDEGRSDFKIEKVDEYYILREDRVKGLVTYVSQEYAAGTKDHTLVIRDLDQYKEEGEWREAALFSFRKNDNSRFIFPNNV